MQKFHIVLFGIIMMTGCVKVIPYENHSWPIPQDKGGTLEIVDEGTVVIGPFSKEGIHYRTVYIDHDKQTINVATAGVQTGDGIIETNLGQMSNAAGYATGQALRRPDENRFNVSNGNNSHGGNVSADATGGTGNGGDGGSGGNSSATGGSSNSSAAGGSGYGGTGGSVAKDAVNNNVAAHASSAPTQNLSSNQNTGVNVKTQANSASNARSGSSSNSNSNAVSKQGQSQGQSQDQSQRQGQNQDQNQSDGQHRRDHDDRGS